MRVCYVYQDQYPWDIRVDKIMNSLVNGGVEGHIISRNRDGLPRNERLRQNLYVHRLPACSNPMTRKIINFPAFFSPFWLKAILSIVKETGAELIIVRDLPLAPTALLAGKLTSLPVLLDMAENYPAMIKDTWKYRGPKVIDFFIRNPWALRALEKLILPKFDGILVVSKYSRERVEKLGVDSDFIWIVSNTPRIDGLEEERDLFVVNNIRSLSEFILLYVGGLEESRGLEIVVRALPKIVKRIPNALIVVVGQGTSESKLKILAKKIGVSEHLLFKGWMEPSLVPSIIRAADVCIVPHFVTEHTDTTIPNKIFDYMAQKKPVIVTNSKSLKEIVESCQCGKIYRDTDPKKLAEAVMELRDPELRKRVGEAGFEAVMKKYNWSVDEKILLFAISKFSSATKTL